MPRNYTEVEISKFNRILNRLSDATMIDLSRFDLIVYGSGGQNQKFYNDLKKDSEVEILMSGRAKSRWMKFFSFFPSEAGLIRILNPLRLKPLFEELGALSSSEIFYIPRELTNHMAEKIFNRDRDVLHMLDDHQEYLYVKAELDDYVQHDPECYYLYDYRIGPGTAAVIRTVFNGINDSD
jgi:hypothetical protein